MPIMLNTSFDITTPMILYLILSIDCLIFEKGINCKENYSRMLIGTNKRGYPYLLGKINLTGESEMSRSSARTKLKLIKMSGVYIIV
jgi:hypothetical protein